MATLARTLVAAPLLLAVNAAAGAAVNHTLAYLPFSWDTIPRYTFCSNSSASYEGYGGFGLFDNESLHYIGKQDIMLYGTAEHRAGGAHAFMDYIAPPQAAALRAVNPKQQQWFYYGIDLVRNHDFQSDDIIAMQHPECLLHDDAGEPVTRTVWDFVSAATVCHHAVRLTQTIAAIRRGEPDRGRHVDPAGTSRLHTKAGVGRPAAPRQAQRRRLQGIPRRPDHCIHDAVTRGTWHHRLADRGTI